MLKHTLHGRKTPTISACMIVKNEERSLPTCLRSIREHVNEIIIVDTGSTDNTVSIAESFGARVVHHPWEDHFSKHRNQSLSYATSEWHLIIDADEELFVENAEILRQVLNAEEDVDAVSVVVECPFADKGATAYSHSIRIFRNQRGIGYRGRVHNYLVGIRKAIHAPVRILHHGFVLDRATQLRRFKRTTALLKKDIQEDPSNPRPRHFLAASYLSEHLNREAAQEAEEAIRLYEGTQTEAHNYLWSLYIASSAYLDMGEIENARNLALRALTGHPDHLDSHFILAAAAYRTRDHEAFRAHMERYLMTRSRIQQDPLRLGEMVHNTFASEWILRLFNAFLSMEMAEKRDVKEELRMALDLCPDPFSYHFTTGRLFLESGKLAEAAQALQKALHIKPDEPQAWWLLSYVHAKRLQFTDQISCLERLLAVDPEFPHAHFQAGLACMREGIHEKARTHFRLARTLEPDNTLALINEALCLRGMGRYEESLHCSRRIEPSNSRESAAVITNEATCYDALGQHESAVSLFLKLEEMDPQSLESPVYLARLCLKKGEIEACVAQCEKLLERLGMEKDITLDRLADLGRLYFLAAKHLASSLRREDLAGICREISLTLGYDGKESSKAFPGACR